MSERTAMEIASILEDSMPICEKAAVIVLRRQHVEIERLTALNSALTAKANALVIANARLDEKIDSLTAERDTAIASAVAAEREACAAACRRRSESAGLYGSASAGALQCERDILARSAT